jgi:hypothetical protein
MRYPFACLLFQRKQAKWMITSLQHQTALDYRAVQFAL